MKSAVKSSRSIPARASAPVASAASAHRARSPLPLLLVGAAQVLFWLLASILQIQTSEAFMLHGPVVSLIPDWNVLQQPVDLVSGHLSPALVKAVMWGWGIELIYLVCVVGYEVAHESVRASNRHLARSEEHTSELQSHSF